MAKETKGENWRKGLSGVIAASRSAPMTSIALHNKAKKLSQKYYGTADLKALQPYQLDKIITWITGKTPDEGKNRDRRAGRSKGRYIKGNI